MMEQIYCDDRSNTGIITVQKPKQGDRHGLSIVVVVVKPFTIIIRLIKNGILRKYVSFYILIDDVPKGGVELNGSDPKLLMYVLFWVGFPPLQ